MKHIITKEDLKDHLKNYKTLITYTRDVNGYKNGVVVAIGAGQTGYSKVNPRDYSGSVKTISNIPYWNRFRTFFLASYQEESLENRFAAVEKSFSAMEKTFWIGNIPKFNRFLALKLAINMAISNHEQKNVPFSIVDSLDDMHVRSMVYFSN